MKMAKHHEDVLMNAQRVLQDIVPADQRFILIVYDGPQLLARQASWLAPDTTQNDALMLMQQVVEQA